LGEIYEFRGEEQLSIESFEVVINNYSAHNKAMDARYKLGKLYHKQGNSKRAIELLKEAAQSNGGAGAKAKAYLKAKGL
jgi:TolA-binding protein